MGEPGGEEVQRRRSYRVRVARGAHTGRVSIVPHTVDLSTRVSRDGFDDDLFLIYFFFSPSKIGKEVITRFRIPFYQNNQTFYTDSNGREMLKRVLNYRPSFELKEKAENVSGNYYPITSRITLTDNRTQFSVLNDRSQGGSSLENGQIELMVRTVNETTRRLRSVYHHYYCCYNYYHHAGPVGAQKAVPGRRVWGGRSAERDRFRSGPGGPRTALLNFRIGRQAVRGRKAVGAAETHQTAVFLREEANRHVSR